jgi:hypothetical protein
MTCIPNRDIVVAPQRVPKPTIKLSNSMRVQLPQIVTETS